MPSDTVREGLAKLLHQFSNCSLCDGRENESCEAYHLYQEDADLILSRYIVSPREEK